MDRLFTFVFFACLTWFSLFPGITRASAQDLQSPPAVALPVVPTTGTPGPAAPSADAANASESDRIAKLPPSENLADTLHARGRYLAAIHIYEALPPTAAILNRMGIACEHMLMFERARTSFLAALKLDPNYADAYNNLGTLAHSQGNLREAEKMYRKALKLNPASASTLQNLGTMYYAQQKFKKGDQAYQQALAIDPHALDHKDNGIQTRGKTSSVSEIHYHLAMTYAQAGSHALALQYLRQAIVEGFHDRNRLLHDKEFADIRTMPVFLQMVDDLKKN